MRLRPQFSADQPDDSPAVGLGARLHIDVTVPRTAIKGRLRIVSRSEAFTIKSSAWRLFQESALASLESVNPLTIADWNMEIAVRHLSVAVRDPDDESRTLSSLEEWRECDDDQIAALWERYQDFREQQDPLGPDATKLTERDVGELRVASKKKDVELLMSYGSRKLAIFAITSGDQPAS